MFYKFMDNADNAYIVAGEKVSQVLGSAKPFIIAIVVAYIFDPVVELFDGKIAKPLFKNNIRTIYRRTISTLCIYTIIIYLIVSAIVYVLPQVLDSIADIFRQSPQLIKNSQKLIMNFVSSTDSNPANIWGSRLSSMIDSLFTMAESKAMETANVIILSTISITSNIVMIIFSTLISIYLVISKQRWVSSLEKLIVAIFGRSFAIRYNIFWRKMNETFIRYVLGKALASLILGCLCFGGLLVMKSPYALLISVIFGVTNMVPYFGPFIGEIIGGILAALIDPWMGLGVFVYLFCLQMADTFIITPKAVGNILKISPVWIMFSVILGGNLFGVPGMFFGAPIIAVIIEIIRDQIDQRIIQKDKKDNIY